MHVMNESVKQLRAPTPLGIGNHLLPRKGIAIAMSICGFESLLGLLVPPSAWASHFNASGLGSAVYSRLSGLSYGAGVDAALLHRDAGLNATNRPKRNDQAIATTYTLCPIDTQNRKSPINVVHLKSYCESQRSPVNPVAGAQDPSVPYLVAPRNGLVRETTPTVRWNPVNGVRRYQIRLVRQRDRQVVWGSEVEASRITLPTRLNLMPGETYQVVVEADNGTSSRMEPCSAGLHFSVLSSDESRMLAKNLTEKRSERGPGLTPENLPLREAEVLFNRGLKAEAFELLKEHEKRNPTLQGQFLLGDLANSQGLNQQAHAYFRQAATLATQAGDPKAVLEANEREAQARAYADQARRGNCEPARSAP